MSSFRISITPSRRAAARFVTAVRRKLLAALEEETQKRGLTQSDIARTIGVHRSVINRELRGKKDITLGRVAELAFALGRTAELQLPHGELRITHTSPEHLSTSPLPQEFIRLISSPISFAEIPRVPDAANANEAPVATPMVVTC